MISPVSCQTNFLGDFSTLANGEESLAPKKSPLPIPAQSRPIGSASPSSNSGWRKCLEYGAVLGGGFLLGVLYAQSTAQHNLTGSDVSFKLSNDSDTVSKNICGLNFSSLFPVSECFNGEKATPKLDDLKPIPTFSNAEGTFGEIIEATASFFKSQIESGGSFALQYNGLEAAIQPFLKKEILMGSAAIVKSAICACAVEELLLTGVIDSWGYDRANYWSGLNIAMPREGLPSIAAKDLENIHNRFIKKFDCSVIRQINFPKNRVIPMDALEFDIAAQLERQKGL